MNEDRKAAYAAEYEIACDASNAHMKSLGLDPHDPETNTGDELFHRAVRGDRTALRCLLAEVSAAGLFEGCDE